jgi:hypothetical protein
VEYRGALAKHYTATTNTTAYFINIIIIIIIIIITAIINLNTAFPVFLYDSISVRVRYNANAVTMHGAYLRKTPWPLVRKRTIPTEGPPLVGEVGANFCG